MAAKVDPDAVSSCETVVANTGAWIPQSPAAPVVICSWVLFNLEDSHALF